jgi:hypothetical protein
VEKCKIHPTIDINMHCLDCHLPLCYKCSTQGDHRRYELIDLETVYADKMALCLEEIFKVDKYFLPTSQDLQKEIKGDATEIKMIMDDLRTAIKADGEPLKSLVDTVVSENMQEADNIEQSLLDKIQSQNTVFDDYISYLHDILKKFYGYLSSSELSNLILKLYEKFPDIRPIPETAKPVTPVFTSGQYSKDDVAKLLGKINLKDTKPEMRKIKAMETVSPSTSVKYINEQKKQDREKEYDVKQTMALSPTVTKVRKFKVPSVRNTDHISPDKSGRVWARDQVGNLVHTDLQGNQLQKKQTSGGLGYHTVTQIGELILTDRVNKVIKKIKDQTITKFTKIRNWEPISIHASHINEEILVGMVKDEEAEVARYNKTGEVLQHIQKDDKGHGLFSDPRYITENINRGICVSDFDKKAVVVMNKSGQHRFSYTGQGSYF